MNGQAESSFCLLARSLACLLRQSLYETLRNYITLAQGSLLREECIPAHKTAKAEPTWRVYFTLSGAGAWGRKNCLWRGL